MVREVLAGSPVVVAPATLTVTANNLSRSYGASDPAYSDTITGFVNGETIGDSGVSGTPSLSSNDTAASPVGTYAVTAGLGSLNAQNYTFAFASGTLSVTPATLMVTANAQIGTQGQANPVLTASYSGFMLNQTLGDSGITGAPGLTTTADTSSPAGAYPITVGLGTLGSTDYSFQFVNSILYVVTSTGDAITGSQSAPVTSTGGPVSVSAAGANPSSPQMTATASGFDGTLTVAQFSSIPTAGIVVPGAYFDVNATPPAGTSLANTATMTLQFQDLTPNVPLFWSIGGEWTEVLNNLGQPVVSDSQGNATVVVSSSTWPTLAQLGGTYFMGGQFQGQREFANLSRSR